MLSIYDPYEEVFGYTPFYQVPLRHLASELLAEFGISDDSELEAILKKAFEVCVTMDIPIKQHFKEVFIASNGNLQTDWLLSDMGIYLLLINGSTHNYHVARAQMHIINGKTH